MTVADYMYVFYIFKDEGLIFHVNHLLDYSHRESNPN